jgi:hypothetical protein
MIAKGNQVCQVLDAAVQGGRSIDELCSLDYFGESENDGLGSCQTCFLLRLAFSRL